MNQDQDLFSRPANQNFGTQPHKLVRRNDPDTSVDAACKVDTTKLEKMVFEAIKGYGEGGCIADDIIAMFPEHPSNTLTPRFKPLLSKGFIVDTGERRMGVHGRKQRVVRAVQ